MVVLMLLHFRIDLKSIEKAFRLVRKPAALATQAYLCPLKVIDADQSGTLHVSELVQGHMPFTVVSKVVPLRHECYPYYSTMQDIA